MKNLLEEIYQHKLIEVREAKKNVHLNDICKKIKCSENKPKDFLQSLQSKINQGQNALICEIKKASPSKGILRANFNAAEIAQIYEKSGAACISVLTDAKYFLGDNQNLVEARQSCSLPILRKDFIVDIYQIYEAKMLGANCILLIVAMLDNAKLQELEQCAFDIGLSVLIEVHDQAELERALKLKSKLIGINNRNLKTLQIDLQTSQNLAPLVPNDRLIIAESGIKSHEDVATLNKIGIRAFLIGEYFMLQKDISGAMKNLVGDLK